MIEHKRGARGANERRLWHGTGARTAPETVLRHEKGVDPRFSRDGLYGPGLYLAENARYSNHDRYVHKSDRWRPRGSWQKGRAVRQLLLMRAALGRLKEYAEYDAGCKNLRKPPEESPGVLFDSVRGGPHQPLHTGTGDDDSYMYVLYEQAQAYPEYVVTYTV